MSISSERVKTWRKHTKEKMIASMGGSCQCCGYNKCTRALSFHHIDPLEKDLGFGAVRANAKSWTKVVEELRKCILVCHNCHSEIHAGERALPSTYAKFDESYAEWRKIKEYNACSVCNKSKVTTLKYCSNKCATQAKRKVDWNNVDLLKLLNEHSISKLEKMFNVSSNAIYNRRNKLLRG